MGQIVFAKIYPILPRYQAFLSLLKGLDSIENLQESHKKISIKIRFKAQSIPKNIKNTEAKSKTAQKNREKTYKKIKKGFKSCNITRIMFEPQQKKKTQKKMMCIFFLQIHALPSYNHIFLCSIFLLYALSLFTCIFNK
jgi:hypothetical protein